MQSQQQGSAPQRALPRVFAGFRPDPPAEYIDKDITNGGHHPDYEGVVFSDGTVSVRWMTTYQSYSNWSDWTSFYLVHGHPEYGTQIVFADGGQAP